MGRKRSGFSGPCVWEGEQLHNSETCVGAVCVVAPVEQATGSTTVHCGLLAVNAVCWWGGRSVVAVRAVGTEALGVLYVQATGDQDGSRQCLVLMFPSLFFVLS